MIRYGSRAGVRLDLGDYTYVYWTEICYTISTASTAQCRMQKQGGNRLHGGYGVQVAKHRQPFPQFKSIPNKTRHTVRQASRVQPCYSSNRGREGGELISKLPFFVLFPSLPLSSNCRNGEELWYYFLLLPFLLFALQCYSNNCLATFSLEQSHFG